MGNCVQSFPDRPNPHKGYLMNVIQNAVVRARIDSTTKERAANALAEMGISISEAIRLFLARVADERCLPFEAKAPNAATRAAIAELEAGRGHKFASVSEMMAALDADD